MVGTMRKLLPELTKFLSEATLATYAGNGSEVKPQRGGFRELEHSDGDWVYRDSYTGYFRSWGQEVVWYKGKPYWNHIYGGGMVKELIDDEDFAYKTFEFLKKALSDGDKQEDFQPRGPNEFENGGWKYVCDWEGDIANFEGSEEIFSGDKLVFTHNFLGGLIVSRSK